MRLAGLTGLIALLAGAAAPAQDVPYVATPPEVVERMLELAQVKAGDVVYDLGCGDGRIVVAAVRAARAVRGVCVEIDPTRLRWSRDAAEAAGVSAQRRLRSSRLRPSGGKPWSLDVSSSSSWRALPQQPSRRSPAARRRRGCASP